MEVKIVFDNTSLNGEFTPGWGFSCLIDKTILFDTGEKSEYIFKNMENLDIDVSKIEKVVISHDHWDHTGGLWHLLKSREGLKVYACPGFSPEFKRKVKKLKGKLIETDRVTEIIDNIFVTGEIAGQYKGRYIGEQALVIKNEKGLTIATGCSHPGIIKIINHVRKDFPGIKIYLVFGGFHLLDKGAGEVRPIAEEFKELGIEKAGPTHCTGDDAQIIFKEVYKGDYIHIKTGLTLEV